MLPCKYYIHQQAHVIMSYYIYFIHCSAGKFMFPDNRKFQK